MFLRECAKNELERRRPREEGAGGGDGMAPTIRMGSHGYMSTKVCDRFLIA